MSSNRSLTIYKLASVSHGGWGRSVVGGGTLLDANLKDLNVTVGYKAYYGADAYLAVDFRGGLTPWLRIRPVTLTATPLLKYFLVGSRRGNK